MKKFLMGVAVFALFVISCDSSAGKAGCEWSGFPDKKLYDIPTSGTADHDEKFEFFVYNRSDRGYTKSYICNDGSWERIYSTEETPQD